MLKMGPCEVDKAGYGGERSSVGEFPRVLCQVHQTTAPKSIKMAQSFL